MRTMRAFLFRVGGLFDRGRRDLEIAEEMEFHLQMQIEDNLRSGMTREQARRQALLGSGGVESAKDAYRDRRGLPAVEALLRDIRYAVRVLRKAPAFTSVVVITLGFCIGLTTALFSLVDAVLIRRLPYPDVDRLVAVNADSATRQPRGSLVSYPNYLDWKRQSKTLSDLAIYTRDSPVTLSGPAGPERIDASRISHNLLDVLGVAPLLGRAFTAEEEDLDQPVAVISFALWQRWFRGAQDVLGRSLDVNGQATRVVGVMPRSFQFPSSAIQLWQPPGQVRVARNYQFGLLVGRLASGVKLSQSQAEIDSLAGQLTLVPFDQQVVAKGVRATLWILFGSVASVLLIGCANAATLLLARGLVRQPEFAIRAALGGSRRRLIAQLLVESLVLCSAAGALGILLASLALRALVVFAPAGTPRLESVAIDFRVLGFTMAASLLCGFLFGLLPAWQISKCDPQQILRGGCRGHTVRPPGRRAHNALIVAEIALSMVLLCGAGLMLGSFMRLKRVSLGFRTEHAIAFRVALAPGENGAAQAEFHTTALQRLKSIPGILDAGVIGNLSLTYNRGTAMDLENGGGIPVVEDSVSPDFFSTLGATLQHGRFFNVSDDENAPPLAIVNETLALRGWPDRDAVGQRFRFSDGLAVGRWITVTGVVSNMRRDGPERQPLAEVFLPLSQRPVGSADFVVRTESGGLALIPAIKRALAGVDSSAPVFRISTLEARLAAGSIPRRFQTGLMTLFAFAALFLAAIGIYGVMHYSVAQRTGEIGIRMAVGARPTTVLGMVLRQGLSLALLGLGIGMTMAFLLSRLFASLPLFGVTPTDPVTFAAVILLISIVAVLACLIPAWRAATADPMSILRRLV